MSAHLVEAAAALASALLLLAGMLYAAARKLDRSVHHWREVWQLPGKVEQLVGSVQAVTVELHELTEAVRERWEPRDPSARGRERREQRWPPANR